MTDAVQNAREVASMVGAYYKELRRNCVGRHLAAELTIKYSNELLSIMRESTKGAK